MKRPGKQPPKSGTRKPTKKQSDAALVKPVGKGKVDASPGGKIPDPDGPAKAERTPKKTPRRQVPPARTQYSKKPTPLKKEGGAVPADAAGKGKVDSVRVRDRGVMEVGKTDKGDIQIAKLDEAFLAEMIKLRERGKGSGGRVTGRVTGTGTDLELARFFDKDKLGRPVDITGIRPGILGPVPGKGTKPAPRVKPDDFSKLKKDVVLTLLPIRLETVFSADGRKLKIRVYPDEIHMDDHDPRLTPAENDAGKKFWQLMQTASDEDEQRRAKEWIIAILSERRAAFVAEATRPEQKIPPKVHKSAGTRPAVARCLPKFWRAVGYSRLSNGTLKEEFRADGAAIPKMLCVDPLYGKLDDDTAPGASNASWMQDFDIAISVGMGMTVDVSDVDSLPDPGLALLLVFGVGGPASAAQSGEMQTLLNAHRYAASLAFQAQGVATNSVEESTSPVATHPAARDGTFDTIFDEPAKGARTNAYRLAQALGVEADPVLARIEGAARDEDAGQAWMNEALWPVTWGQYFTKLMASKQGNKVIPAGAITYAREAFLRDVRGAGPLPALRVGAQPYGVLPVRAHHVPTAWKNTEPWFEFLLVSLRTIWLNATPNVAKLSPGGNGTRQEALSEVVKVLGGLPHPTRFLVRKLEDWRTKADTDPWGDIGLALLGLVWLVEDDPEFGYEAQSILGQWGWGRAMLGEGWSNADGAGLSAISLNTLDGPDVTSPEDQINRLNMLISFYSGAPFISAENRSKVKIWAEAMIRQVGLHKKRLDPYLGDLPIETMVNMDGVLRDASLDPEIAFHLYSKSPREFTRRLVAGRSEAEGDGIVHIPSLYLPTIAAGVRAERVTPDIDFKTPLPFVDAILRPGSPVQTNSSLGRTVIQRSQPALGVAQPLRSSGIGAAAGGVPSRVQNEARVNDEPLLKQLTEAAAGQLERGQRNGFKAALNGLADLPQATLEWHMRETLGLASNRLDAWLTALATRRMREMKGGNRAQFGGYGFVLDLKPGPASETDGFLHAPSLQLAATGAILRSAWLNHGRDDTQSPLAVNLSSDRLRMADRLFEGVSQGRGVGEILGQDFERALHDSEDDVVLYDMRAAVLAASAKETGDKTPEVRGPVDGLDLLAAYDAGTLDPTIQAVKPQPRRTRILQAIEKMRSTFDALGDAGLAEATHYLAQGNAARAAGVLDALSLGEAPPSELRHARTDIAKSELEHSVLLALPDQVANIARLTQEGQITGRAFSHPGLNHYVQKFLPSIKRLSITVVNGDDVHQLSLGALDLSPLDLVCETARSGALGRRAMTLLAVDGITLSPEAYALTSLGAKEQVPGLAPEFEDFEELCVQLASHLGALRLPRPSDFGLQDVDDGFGQTELLADHLAGLAQRMVQRASALESAIRSADKNSILTLLAILAQEGLPEALPGPAQLAGVEGSNIRDHASLVLTTLKARRFAAEAALNGPASAAAYLGALQAAGDAMLVPEVPVAKVGLPFGARRGFKTPTTQAALLGWVGSYAHVREDIARWSKATDTSFLMQSRPAWPLDVTQISTKKHQEWLGTHLPEDGSPGGKSWVAVNAGGVSPLNRGAPCVVYFIDKWTERLPARTTTTGVAFHFDAPASKPPQAILLATTPNQETAWDSALLERTLIETLENAQLRAVTNDDLDQFGHHLPAIFVPGAIDAGPQPAKPTEDGP